MVEVKMEVGIFLSIRRGNLWYNLTTFFQIVLLPWLLQNYTRQRKMNLIKILQSKHITVFKIGRTILKASGVRVPMGGK